MTKVSIVWTSGQLLLPWTKCKWQPDEFATFEEHTGIKYRMLTHLIPKMEIHSDDDLRICCRVCMLNRFSQMEYRMKYCIPNHPDSRSLMQFINTCEQENVKETPCLLGSVFIELYDIITRSRENTNSRYMQYNDVMMSAMASQITSVSTVCSIVGTGPDQTKHQSSATLAFVRGIHRWPVNSPTKG